MEGVSAWTGRRRKGLVVVELPAPEVRFGLFTGRKDYLVEPEHADELREVVHHAYRYDGAFLLQTGVLTFGVFLGAFLSVFTPSWQWLGSAALALLAIRLWTFPFVPPGTLPIFGYLRMRRFVQTGCVVLVILAILRAPL